MARLSEQDLDLVFRHGRTHRAFAAESLSDADLAAIWDLAKLGPTAMNSVPARVVFVRSPEAKEKLVTTLASGNEGPVRAAPVTAVICYDTAFFEQWPTVSPHKDLTEVFAKKAASEIEQTARDGAWLETGYFIMAARSLGFDCGPMGGFSNAKFDEAFLTGTTWKSLVIVNLGHGDPSQLMPRLGRVDFASACKVL